MGDEHSNSVPIAHRLLIHWNWDVYTFDRDSDVECTLLTVVYAL
jgi:hypothetical protein